jgi:enoyl-[acyl-carrier protein] reductase/trans-2-enoyl-CoA reductase (NAD+)
MRPDVQGKVAKLWNEAVTENLSEISDLEGYRKDFTICLVLQ